MGKPINVKWSSILTVGEYQYLMLIKNLSVANNVGWTKSYVIQRCDEFLQDWQANLVKFSFILELNYYDLFKRL